MKENLNGAIIKTYNLKVDMDLKVATSMKDVENSDHLFVLADSDSKASAWSNKYVRVERL